MQIFQEVLDTDAQYKATVKQHGDIILSVLDYLYRRDTKNVIESEKIDSEKVKDLKKLRNLSDLIQDIKNAKFSDLTAPTFNL